MAKDKDMKGHLDAQLQRVYEHIDKLHAKKSALQELINDPNNTNDDELFSGTSWARGVVS